MPRLIAEVSQNVADEMQQKSDKTPYDVAKIASREGRFNDSNNILMFLLSLESQSTSIWGKIGDNYRDMEDYGFAALFYLEADTVRILKGSEDTYFQDEYRACVNELKKAYKLKKQL